MLTYVVKNIVIFHFVLILQSFLQYTDTVQQDITRVDRLQVMEKVLKFFIYSIKILIEQTWNTLLHVQVLVVHWFKTWEANQRVEEKMQFYIFHPCIFYSSLIFAIVRK